MGDLNPDAYAYAYRRLQAVIVAFQASEYRLFKGGRVKAAGSVQGDDFLDFFAIFVDGALVPVIVRVDLLASHHCYGRSLEASLLVAPITAYHWHTRVLEGHLPGRHHRPGGIQQVPCGECTQLQRRPDPASIRCGGHEHRRRPCQWPETGDV